jgi:ATP-dependent DNA helicase DinG
MSFWEGVDVPGAALRLVVIDRLPFPVPTDPLVRARGEALAERGISAFSGDSLPRAALILKQGFGRLLRRRDDLGVVAILDRRICSRSYGRALVASLPAVRQTRDLEDVMSFWTRDDEPEPLTGS